MDLNFERFHNWYASREFREQIVFLAACLLSIFIAWKFIFFDRLLKNQASIENEVRSAQKKLDDISKEFSSIQNDQKKMEQIKKQIKTSQQELDKINESIENFTKNLISPKEMTIALRAILEKTPGLRLTQIQSQPAKKVMQSQASAMSDQKRNKKEEMPDTQAINLYIHGMYLEFEGDYNSVYRYVKRLENLKWQLLWDGITYTVDTYPTAKVKIWVHTLSDSEAWIGT